MTCQCRVEHDRICTEKAVVRIGQIYCCAQCAVLKGVSLVIPTDAAQFIGISLKQLLEPLQAVSIEGPTITGALNVNNYEMTFADGSKVLLRANEVK